MKLKKGMENIQHDRFYISPVHIGNEIEYFVRELNRAAGFTISAPEGQYAHQIDGLVRKGIDTNNIVVRHWPSMVPVDEPLNWPDDYYDRQNKKVVGWVDTRAYLSQQTGQEFPLFPPWAQEGIDLAQPDEKPLTPTERNTLLTIIAALCDYSAIDTNARGTAQQIANLSQEIGAPITDDTIRKILAKIPDALERRKK